VPITIFGPWHDATSWSQHARQFAAALGRIEEVGVVAYDAPPDLAAAPSPEADVIIAIGAIERMSGLAGRYRIGFMVWETTLVPRQKMRILEDLDEVWVPSDWGRAVLIANGLSADRVHVVPEGVDPSLFRPAEAAPDAAPRPFRFLCVGKWEVRKGIDDLVRAFAREFAPDEPVELILHCHNPYVPRFDTGRALERLALPPHAPIRPSPPLPLRGLAELYAACDVLVLPTRAEGWGLPIIEAMACGIPAIATNYSGHTMFLNDDNGYLVDVERMIPVDDPFFYGTAEPLGEWAQPDVHHLQALMRRAYANAAERRAKGLRARRDVARQWTWDEAARIAHRRLSAI
jgi:glycosyltransferase involved in cell wall biosynthesis